MRRNLFLIATIIGITVVVAHSVQSNQETKRAADTNKSSAAPDRSADENSIRANVKHFVDAYNAGNAKAISELFMPDGQIINKEGEVTEGREAIAKVFESILSATPKKKIETEVESIRFIGSDLAVEVGTTKESDASNEPPEYDRYTVLHVKRDGKWQMALARDEEGAPPSAHEQLKALAWLVGEWIDDGGSTVVASTCRWSDDKNFLLQTFNLKISGREAMTVSQRIAWDPQLKCVHSWVFDSEGGFGESLWTRDGDNWIIKATGVRPDGSTASATNHLAPIGTDGYVWRSTDRIVAGEHQEPAEVKVVRKPPEPKR